MKEMIKIRVRIKEIENKTNEINRKNQQNQKQVL